MLRTLKRARADHGLAMTSFVRRACKQQRDEHGAVDSLDADGMKGTRCVAAGCVLGCRCSRLELQFGGSLRTFFRAARRVSNENKTTLRHIRWSDE